eukprot:PLAT10744.2.p1 GENE.PLAT10744.2~~PLAT10744.2.p1  ORF type:complete len:320 (+),score=91.28 PLAT10744.2:66-962(+)
MGKLLALEDKVLLLTTALQQKASTNDVAEALRVKLDVMDLHRLERRVAALSDDIDYLKRRKADISIKPPASPVASPTASPSSSDARFMRALKEDIAMLKRQHASMVTAAAASAAVTSEAVADRATAEEKASFASADALRDLRREVKQLTAVVAEQAEQGKQRDVKLRLLSDAGQLRDSEAASVLARQRTTVERTNNLDATVTALGERLDAMKERWATLTRAMRAAVEEVARRQAEAATNCAASVTKLNARIAASSGNALPRIARVEGALARQVESCSRFSSVCDARLQALSDSRKDLT